MGEGQQPQRNRIPLSAFGAYLRTGRLGARADVEIKFNPWHDPANGRFTFAGAGRYYGGWTSGGFRGGGGGSTGGGGADGSWDAPKSQPAPTGRTGARAPRTALPRTGAVAHTAIRPVISQRSAETESATWRHVMRNGYDYQIDTKERTRQVSGTLHLNPAQTRSRAMQANAGGTDRRATDDGGHYIARRFDGPTDAFNHFAQDANFNRGGYRALEDQWTKATREGKRVFVRITPSYEGSSKRPASINVWFTTDGAIKMQNFPNESMRKPDGKR